MYPQNDCLESDWKLFRKRIPVWQENYMAKLMEEYQEILDSEKSPSEKFGTLEKRLWEDRKCPGVVIDMRRSTMRNALFRMLSQGVIQRSDLEGFSQELRDSLNVET